MQLAPATAVSDLSPDTRALRHEAWRRGQLAWKLLPHQHQLAEWLARALSPAASTWSVMECARRFGKTTTLLIAVLEHGLRNRRHMIRWASSTVLACRDIVHPIFEQLAEDAPIALRPQWHAQDGYYEFPSTGSRFYLRGTDDPRQRERLRGTACHFGIIDEAGYAHELDYVLRSILLPQCLTVGGRVVLASNAPLSPQHDFCALVDEAKLAGSHVLFTADQNSSLSAEQRETIERNCGGRASTTFRREYLCEHIAEAQSVVVPEWAAVREASVCEFSPSADPLSPYHQRYESLDHSLGVDLTECLFGYYDFPRAQLWVEREFSINGPAMTTLALAEGVLAVEREWPTYANARRIADNNNPLLLADLGALHGLHFTPVGEGTGIAGRPKENLEAMINELRLFVAAGRLRVHPRCKHLIACLEGALWDERRREWTRHRLFGHWDALAALMYLVRALDQRTNPIPPALNVSRATHHVSAEVELQLREGANARSAATWAGVLGQRASDREGEA